MVNPEEVKPHNFTQLKPPLYNKDGFSIVKGKWKEDDEYRLAMRWNGEKEDNGYPKQGKYPLWFVLPLSLSKKIEKAIEKDPSLFC